MSHKLFREENKVDLSTNLSVVPKCLAIVLISKSQRNSTDHVFENNKVDESIVDSTDGNIIQSSEVCKNISSSGYNGKELLQDFKIRNKTCYWNPSLVESIKSLEYKGFVEPSTILVTAASIHLENLRSAWGRRVLKSPAGFLIKRIGDVNSIEMQVIPQTQFMPLPDALCSIVMDMNVARIMATLDAIMEKLALRYKDITVPSSKLVVETLVNLIQDRKVFHTGSGYFVVTPDTSRLQTSAYTSYLPTHAPWLPYHAMYVPVFQGEQLSVLPSKTFMRSISCQVTTIEESCSDDENNTDRKKGSDKQTAGQSPQIENLGHCSEKGEEKYSKSGKSSSKAETHDGEFKRPSSYKCKGETVKAVKDVNLKSSSASQEKQKGEKTSLFSKLFSRKRKDKKDKDKALMPPPPPPPVSLMPTSVITSTSGSDTMSDGKGDKEYATFSAQFPPPEWVWYQQQLQKNKRTETWVAEQSIITEKPLQLPSTTSRPLKGTKSHAPNDNAKHASIRPTSRFNQNYMPMSAVSSLEEKCIDTEVRKQEYHRDFVKPLSVRPENIYETFSNAASANQPHTYQKFQDLDRKQYQMSSNYSVVGQADVTPISSSVYQSVLNLSPVARPHDGSTYSKQPQLGPYHSTPVCGGQGDRTANRKGSREERDRIHGPPDACLKRKSHRSRGRHKRMYSYCSSQGSDISYEYKGRLPNKNSSHAQSKDSGVNCVGLGMPRGQEKRKIDPVYENTPNKLHQERHHRHHQHHRNKHPHHHSNKQPHHRLPAANVQFEVNNAGGNNNTQLSSLNGVDSTTNSVAYQSNITNTAYNSVVYGSVTDITGEPSGMGHTAVSSHLESSERPFPHNSLQSAFYEDSNVGLTSSCTTSGPKKLNTLQGLIESQSSPETAIVDVVGSPSEESDFSGGVVELAAETQKRVAGPSNTDTAKMCGHQRAGAINNAEGGTEACANHHCSCRRRLVLNQQQGENIDTIDHCGGKQSSERTFSQPTFAVTQGGQYAISIQNNCVLDSGFSSPRNPKKSGGRTKHDQANTSRENNCGCNDHEQHHHHHSTSDSSNTHQLSTNGSSGHHSNSVDVCTTTSIHQHSESTNENENVCNGVPSGQRYCDQITCQKAEVSVKLGAILKPLKSHSHQSQQLQPSSQHQITLQYHQQHQNLVDHNHPTAKHVHHCEMYNNAVSNNHQFRVPLHPNAMLSMRRSHYTSKPPQDRSHLGHSDMPRDLKQCEDRELSQKHGEAFEVMGVL